jgi:hypothetical protein
MSTKHIRGHDGEYRMMAESRSLLRRDCKRPDNKSSVSLTIDLAAASADATTERGLMASVDRAEGDPELSREVSVRNRPAWHRRKCLEKRALSVLQDDIFLGKRFSRYSEHLRTWSMPSDHCALPPPSSWPLGWL